MFRSDSSWIAFHRSLSLCSWNHFISCYLQTIQLQYTYALIQYEKTRWEVSGKGKKKTLEPLRFQGLEVRVVIACCTFFRCRIGLDQASYLPDFFWSLWCCSGRIDISTLDDHNIFRFKCLRPSPYAGIATSSHPIDLHMVFRVHDTVHTGAEF